MTPSEQSNSVRNTRWANDGKVKAVCNVAGCGWTKLAGQGVAVAGAKRHALATGHEVYLVRRQARFTIPEGRSYVEIVRRNKRLDDFWIVAHESGITP